MQCAMVFFFLRAIPDLSATYNKLKHNVIEAVQNSHFYIFYGTQYRTSVSFLAPEAIK